MKKLVGVLSISLWAAALTFTPAPADAGFWARYPSIVSYFACANYATMSSQQCLNSNQDVITFTGYMSQTTPVTSCSGSCNGSVSLIVAKNPGNGRKQLIDDYGQCLNQYILWMQPCLTCA